MTSCISSQRVTVGILNISPGKILLARRYMPPKQWSYYSHFTFQEDKDLCLQLAELYAQGKVQVKVNDCVLDYEEIKILWSYPVGGGGGGGTCICTAPAIGTGLTLGDVVYATAQSGGTYTVELADPSDPETMPASAVVIEQTGVDAYTIQFSGPLRGIYTGVTTPAVYYVGIDGRLARSTDLNFPTYYLIQQAGVGTGDDEIYINFQDQGTLRLYGQPVYGPIDGVNTTFTTATSFVHPGENFYYNGAQLYSGKDYTAIESGGPGTGYDTLSMYFPPVPGDYLEIDYSVAPLVVKIPGGGAVYGFASFRIAEIEGVGSVVVSDKTYQDNPQDTVLRECTASDANVRVHLVSAYPLARIETTAGTYSEILTVAGDSGTYSGYIDIVISPFGELIKAVQTLPNDDDGSFAYAQVNVEEPPEFTDLSFTGTYPGIQNEYKAGDTVQIIGTVDVPCDAVEIMGPTGSYTDGACINQLITFAETMNINVTATIADQGTVTVKRPAYVRPRNAAGAYGAVRATNFGGGTTDHVHEVYCNNFYYSIVFGAITYPGSQQALKSSETATIVNTITGFIPTDSISYTSPNGDLSITSPSSYQTPKTVQRVSGTYNVSVDNLQIEVTKVSNGAVTTESTVINIANVAPTITITEPYTRLQSGGNDGTSIQDHVITLTSTQELLTAPTLPEAVGGGTFIGVWSGGPSTWTRTLQVHDDDIKGVYNWTGLVATNLAGTVVNTITGDATYTLGGFVDRVVGYSAYSQNSSINVAIVDYSKLEVGINNLNNNQMLINPVQGDVSDIVNTVTVLTIGNNPTTVFLNDQTLAAQNTTGNLEISFIREIV